MEISYRMLTIYQNKTSKINTEMQYPRNFSQMCWKNSSLLVYDTTSIGKYLLMFWRSFRFLTSNSKQSNKTHAGCTIIMDLEFLHRTWEIVAFIQRRGSIMKGITVKWLHRGSILCWKDINTHFHRGSNYVACMYWVGSRSVLGTVVGDKKT